MRYPGFLGGDSRIGLRALHAHREGSGRFRRSERAEFGLALRCGRGRGVEWPLCRPVVSRRGSEPPSPTTLARAVPMSLICDSADALVEPLKTFERCHARIGSCPRSASAPDPERTSLRFVQLVGKEDRRTNVANRSTFEGDKVYRPRKWGNVEFRNRDFTPGRACKLSPCLVHSHQRSSRGRFARA